MQVEVLNKAGQATGRKVDLPEEIFGIEPNQHVIYLAVKQYLAAQRQGTHKTKERWEIARTTKKAFRQKGTGGARRGDMKSPLVRGGARVFGPKPHDYDFKLNKKVKDLARKSALSYKAKDGKILVVEDFTIETPKTKEFVGVLSNLKLNGVKSTLVFGEISNGLFKSARNVQGVNLVTASALNIYDIMNSKTLVLSENAVKAIEEALSNN